MEKRWNVFPFLITTLVTISKPCVEKLSNHSKNLSVICKDSTQ